MFSLASQIRRAADSMVQNICEGSTGLSNPGFKRFLNIALRSAIEVVGCLMMAKRRNYIDENIYQALYEKYDHLCRMITKFRDSLN